MHQTRSATGRHRRASQYRDCATAPPPPQSGHPRAGGPEHRSQRVSAALSKGLTQPGRRCRHEARRLIMPALRGVPANAFGRHCETEIPPGFTNLDQKLCQRTTRLARRESALAPSKGTDQPRPHREHEAQLRACDHRHQTNPACTAEIELETKHRLQAFTADQRAKALHGSTARPDASPPDTPR
jgi:hypothetical protein